MNLSAEATETIAAWAESSLPELVRKAWAVWQILPDEHWDADLFKWMGIEDEQDGEKSLLFARLHIELRRHNPIVLRIDKPSTSETWDVPLLDFLDCLHAESPDDHGAIVEMATRCIREWVRNAPYAP